uniref:thioredoxin-dependent peroxiredoxin n=1 Tax=Phaeocystis antarctica TaxID=33657 RepID=A0A7S0HCU2_9EUKA|mmetsp:Transcript_19738/g.46770  ORF Transcript_19738/g.46770 Transcript_19738/m.46770 type:complete len:287 (+) Transcript_19738:58-918(+)
MLLLWLASAGVQISGRRSVLKLAAGLSATGAGMQTAAGAEGGLQQAADVYQNFDRALAAKQREVAAPLVDAKQRGDARMTEQGKKFDATMEKLNNCQVFRPVGDGGGCALTNGQKVFAFSDVLCHNCEGALGAGPKERRVSLADFTEGGKWVVLWFFPEGGLFGGGNEAEAVQFERMLREFAALDAVVVGCSTQSAAEQRRSLVAPRKLTFPFLSDAGRVVAEAYGAADDFGTGTKRQTFIIDPTGRLRWQEVNIEFGIGEFNVENHPRRVLRNFERERSQDGWQV